MDYRLAHFEVENVKPFEVLDFCEEVKQFKFYEGQIQHSRNLPAQDARYGKLDYELPAEIDRVLRLNLTGFHDLYIHQAESLNELHKGKHVIIATSTSSGKSLCYTIPVLCKKFNINSIDYLS